MKNRIIINIEELNDMENRILQAQFMENQAFLISLQNILIEYYKNKLKL